MNYPIKRAPQQKQTNYANLGMTLESDIESTNLFYLNQKIAVIHKKPTPVQVVNVSYPARNKAKITEAYYKTPSTTDFNGVFEGKYIDFDAKETNSKTSMPLKNIHPHQMEHLENVSLQGGIAFLIVHFKQYNEYYLLPFHILEMYWKQQYDKEKGRKSIPYNVFKEQTYLIPFGYQPRLDYLSVVKKYLIKS
ncbi:MAG: Holliday junction resolvase RecU [Acholeplasmataceae bacterium]|nr:Holliday junction resolvase RecU [Acholeplasmataceae bacterium]